MLLGLSFNVAYAQDLEWANAIGGSDWEKCNDIAVDNYGNNYITGFFEGTIDFDPSLNTANLSSNGYKDIFVAKYDVDGNYIWAINIGGAEDDKGYSITVDDNGNSYVTGSFYFSVDFDPSDSIAYLTTNGASDIFIAKFDNDGNYVWSNSVGGLNHDMGCSIDIDDDYNIYVTGNFFGTVDFDPSIDTANLTPNNGSDVFIIKYDNVGNFLWANNFGGEFLNQGKSIKIDNLGDIYVTGYFTGTCNFDNSDSIINLSSEAYIFIAKFDQSGNYLWAKGIGSGSANSIAVDNSGNTYITGSFSGELDFDPSTNTAILTSNYWGVDIFMAKYDADGNYIWAKNIGDTSGDEGYGIAIDNSDNIYITGFFKGIADFDPSAGVANLMSDIGSDVFIAKYNTDGNYIWAYNIGGNDYDAGKSLDIDNHGNIYISCAFSGTVDFDLSTDYTILTSIGDNDIFISKYSQDNSSVDIDESSTNQIIKLYPNPTKGILSIDIQDIENQESFDIVITDITGKTIKQFNNVTDRQFKIDLSKQSTGLYFIKLSNKDNSVVRKFVVE